MNLDMYEQRALEYGLVPVVYPPHWRKHLCVQRVTCGCYLKVHYAPKPLANVAAKCPRCGDTNAPAPVTSLGAYADVTYEGYVKQVMHDYPHLARSRQDSSDTKLSTAIDEVMVKLENTAPPKPERTVLDAFVDEIAANVRHLFNEQRQRDAER